MSKYCIEMCYGIGFTVEDIEADSEHDAIKKAQEKVSNEVSVLEGDCNSGDLEFEQVTYIGKK